MYYGENQRNYYLKHRKEILERRQKYAEENKERLREYYKEYYRANKDKIKKRIAKSASNLIKTDEGYYCPQCRLYYEYEEIKYKNTDPICYICDEENKKAGKIVRYC